MEKQEFYYKVCELYYNDLTDISRFMSISYTLMYELNKKTVAPFGKLFVFGTEKEAVEYCNLIRGTVVVKGTVDGNVYNPREINHYLCSYYYSDFESFWRFITSEKYYSIDTQTVQNSMLNQHLIRTNLLPPGTLLCDDFTPVELVFDLEKENG